MMSRARSIAALIVLVQSEFLDTPGLRLSDAQAAHYFGIDRETCAAILAVLADAGVLGTTPDGRYLRCVPRVPGTPRASMTSAQPAA